MHQLAHENTTGMGFFYDHNSGIQCLFYEVNLGIQYDVNAVGYRQVGVIKLFNASYNAIGISFNYSIYRSAAFTSTKCICNSFFQIRICSKIDNHH